LILYICLILFLKQFSYINSTVRVFLYRGHNFYKYAYALHMFFNTTIFSAQVIIWVLAMLFVFKDKISGFLILFSNIFQSVAVEVTKHLVQNKRPPQEYFGVFENNFSFPSGHTASSMTIAICLLYIGRSENKYRIIGGIYFLLALLTAYSRIYLDVHWLTDIIGGWITAGFSVSIFVYINKGRSRE
jgi:membrane-associated phospholipid phosphatase